MAFSLIQQRPPPPLALPHQPQCSPLYLLNKNKTSCCDLNEVTLADKDTNSTLGNYVLANLSLCVSTLLTYLEFQTAIVWSFWWTWMWRRFFLEYIDSEKYCSNSVWAKSLQAQLHCNECIVHRKPWFVWTRYTEIWMMYFEHNKFVMLLNADFNIALVFFFVLLAFYLNAICACYRRAIKRNGFEASL